MISGSVFSVQNDSESFFFQTDELKICERKKKPWTNREFSSRCFWRSINEEIHNDLCRADPFVFQNPVHTLSLITVRYFSIFTELSVGLVGDRFYAFKMNWKFHFFNDR